MRQRIIAKAVFPVVKVMFHIFRGADVFRRTISDVSVDELRKGALLPVRVKVELAFPDFLCDVSSSVFGFLLTVKMVANGRVALYTDDCAPVARCVFIFTLLILMSLLKPLGFWFERPDGGAG